MNDDKEKARSRAQQIRDLTSKALKLVVVNYASRLLGLVRTVVLAVVFGASTPMDVFWGTFGAVLVFFEIIPSAFMQAFVPVYSKYLTDKKEDELNTVSLSFTYTGAVLLLAIFFILSMLAEQIVPRIYVFGDAGAELMDLGILMFRYALLVMLINYFVGNFSAILYARENVVVPSMVNFLKNIIIIVLILALGKSLGVAAIALAFVAGGIFQMIFLLWIAIKTGWRVTFPKKIPFDIIGTMWMLFLPAFTGHAVAQINIVIDRYFTSRLQNEGEVSVLSFANLLIALITVFATSLTIAIFPKYSRQVSRKEIDELKDMLNSALRALFFFIFPLMTIVALLSSPIVFAVFNYGEMRDDPHMVGLIQSLFRIFCVWVIFYSINYQLIMVFFSFRDAMTPMWTSAFNVGLNVLFNWLFTVKMSLGVQGIVVSTTISAIITTVVMLILIYPRVGRVFDARILKSTARTILSCLPVVGVIIAYNLVTHSGWIYQSSGKLGFDVLYMAVASIIGIAVYCFGSLILNRDLALYFIKNMGSFLSLTKR